LGYEFAVIAKIDAEICNYVMLNNFTIFFIPIVAVSAITVKCFLLSIFGFGSIKKVGVFCGT
jgi:hypothetical protein